MTARRRAAAGVSLLEALVAVALLGLIGVAAAGGMRFGVAVWDRSAEETATLTEARAVRTYLRRQIEAAHLLQIRSGRRDPPALFNGAASSLEFPAPLPATLAPPGERLVRLSFDRREDGRYDLALRWRELDGLRPPRVDPNAEAEILLSGLAAGAFSYFGPAAGSEPAAWFDEWSGRSDLPRLVSVIAEDDRGAQSPLVVRIAPRRLAADAE